MIIFQPERIRKRWQYNAIFYILRRLLNLKNPSTVWSVFIIYIKALLHIVSQLCDNLTIALWGRTPAVRAVARSSTGVRRPRMPTAVRTAAPGPQVDGATRAAALQRERTGRRTTRLHLYSPRSWCASASLFVRLVPNRRFPQSFACEHSAPGGRLCLLSASPTSRKLASEQLRTRHWHGRWTRERHSTLSRPAANCFCDWSTVTRYPYLCSAAIFSSVLTHLSCDCRAWGSNYLLIVFESSLSYLNFTLITRLVRKSSLAAWKRKWAHQSVPLPVAHIQTTFSLLTLSGLRRNALSLRAELQYSIQYFAFE